jgi:hypothetical protein
MPTEHLQMLKEGHLALLHYVILWHIIGHGAKIALQILHILNSWRGSVPIFIPLPYYLLMMRWPDNKRFAFTVVDDTDNATVQNIAPVYDLLTKLGMRTTKTVWVYPSRDRFTGETLQDRHHVEFILSLRQKGFEIGLHGVGSGAFGRSEIFAGLEFYKECLGTYPSMHINHAQSPHNIHWGNSACSKFLQAYARWRSPNDRFFGHDPSSDCYWGDFAKKHVKYMRSRSFKDINTLKHDPRMPYRDRDKEASSNFWFSSSDGANVRAFTSLISPESVDRLEAEGGCCIVYTHFASGFVDGNGQVDPAFQANLEYLAAKGGWFVPAGTLLDHLLNQRSGEYESEAYFTWLDIKRMLERRFS